MAPLLGLFLAAFLAQAPEPPSKPLDEQAQDWRTVLAKHGLAAEDIEKLGRDKVLVTQEAFKQVFVPYTGSSVPVFITSDSLLNAFHVLFEESVRRMEEENAKDLPRLLAFLWKGLGTVDEGWKGRPELISAAKRRAQAVLGTAMVLLGEPPAGAEASIAETIRDEAARVVAAEGQAKPAWLGPPDPGFLAIDYSRYRARGFYTQSEPLSRYFRAVAWLQSIPFRPAIEEELLSAFMLGLTVNDMTPQNEGARPELDEFARLTDAWSEFVGTGDDLTIRWWSRGYSSKWAHLDLSTRTVAEAVEWDPDELRLRGYSQINDTLSFAPEDPTQSAEVSLRILPAHRTPDAVLFQRTTDPRDIERACPNGLEVCISLGSKTARGLLPEKDRARILEIVDGNAKLFETRSLYGRYLSSLATLLDEPEPDAPPLFGSDPWRLKSCQTALAGWAQMRHTWVLQSKLHKYYAGLTDTPPGFIEPDPEFFSLFSDLVERIQSLLRANGALGPDYVALAALLDRAANRMEKSEFVEKGAQAFADLRDEQGREHALAMHYLAWVGLEFQRAKEERERLLQEAVACLRSTSMDLREGRAGDRPMVRRLIDDLQLDLEPHWRSLAEIGRRLETLSHKQLRKIPFSRGEASFIRSYGERVASVMLYDGNSWLTPHDDAPRIVDVFSTPRTGCVLEVGVGRPHAIWVLYPTPQGEVLCKGAVMPYYEFAHEKRLTDGDWKAFLDSPERPSPPAWVAPLLGKEGLGASDGIQDD